MEIQWQNSASIKSTPSTATFHFFKVVSQIKIMDNSRQPIIVNQYNHNTSILRANTVLHKNGCFALQPTCVYCQIFLTFKIKPNLFIIMVKLHKSEHAEMSRLLY